MKVGWISSWNVKCGIAEYSRFLLKALDPRIYDVTILAAENNNVLKCDDARTIRCWTNCHGRIASLLHQILNRNFDVVVVQFSFAFFSVEHLEALVAAAKASNARIVIVMHAVRGADITGELIGTERITKTLHFADRTLVHTADDETFLCSLGLRANVQRIRHGQFDPGPLVKSECRAIFGLPSDDLLIASYGFLLPHKGIGRLIEAVALLRAKGVPASLLLVNALYPLPISQRLLSEYRKLASTLDISEHVIFETRFLPNRVSATLLGAADAVVFPYDDTNESSSAAVRFGLSVRRPVITTQLSIFSDVADVVTFLRSNSADDIVDAIERALRSEETLDGEIPKALNEWLRLHDWHEVGRQFASYLSESREVRGVPSVGHYLENYFYQSEAQAHELRQVLASNVDLTTQIEALSHEATAQIEAFSRQLDTLRRSEQHWRVMADSANRQIEALQNSTSWRVTQPLRDAQTMRLRLKNGGGRRLTRGLVASLKKLRPRALQGSRDPISCPKDQVDPALARLLTVRAEILYGRLRKATRTVVR
jgi:glycosyltransferase involved in cell wall biosynthesis